MTRLEMREARKKKNTYKIYAGIALAVLLVFLIIFLSVRNLMVAYERNAPENYVVWLVKEANEKSDLGKFLEEHNFSDSRYGNGEARKEAFYSAIKEGEITASLVPGNYDTTHPSYNIQLNGNPFMQIELNELASKSKLGGIMTISDWGIDYAFIRNTDKQIKLSESGKLDFEIVMPEDFTLLIDGEKANLEPAEEVELEEFKLASKTVAVPKGVRYEITDLAYEPNLSALNNGGEKIEFEKDSNGNYYAKPEFAATKEAEEFIMKIVDPLGIGENWSRLMTDDLGGDLHGFYTAINGCRLLYNTDPYNQAYKWVTSVDITFVSAHTLMGFANEKVSNFVKYNDSLYSCDVYFEKNMLVNGQKTDVFNNRLFFGAAWGTWYLLDMTAL